MTSTVDARTAAPGWTARATVLGAAAMTLMAAALIAPSLPELARLHPGSEVLVRLVLTVTSLAIAIGAPVAGLLADRVGRRPLLVAGLVLSATAGPAGGVVTGLGPLIATRVLLGLGIAAIMTAVTALVTDWYAGPERARFLGLQQASASLGGVVLLPVAGLLAQTGWTAPFWLYALAAVLVPGALLAVREPARPRARTPVAAPRSRGVLPVYVLALVATAVFYLAPTQLPFLLEEFALGPAATGALIAVSTLSGAAGALAFPRLRRRLDAPALVALSLALLGGGWVLVGTASGAAPVVVGLLAGGTGVGLTVPTLNLHLGELAPPERRARVLSGLVTAVFLGQFLSPLAAHPLIEVAGTAGAFTATGLATAAGAALLRLVRTTPTEKEQ